ncbi:MarR family transcriptional regulator [Methanococcus maripaludis]|uniref:DNA-binding MarR family transcriptional regulator n=1 Tax=Methanococcus maripaludis TaxID=39152 RepID=A0A7J9P223_METMI|nr:MarR family transcriptional regulator [Methanococcus maripaludis]MBA2853979.1 DNA-binding MarR family transcriptional regulator [Methanococcus maripaludis]MBA2860888.1 DNA-binding MarR family transcriptional regulator [Methanococcus maripaludis]
MELVNDTYKIWEYMYAVSRNCLYQGIPKKEFLEISMSDKIYLETVYYMENPKISEIAEKLHYTSTAITNMTKKLEKKGYIKRIKSEEDKREVHLELTKKGNYLFLWKEEMHKITVNNIKELLNPEEFENFKYLLGKISKDFENKLDVIYDQNKNINKSDWPPII